jgi:hypothetical protein
MPADSSPNLGRHKVTARLSPTGALSLRQFKDGDDLAFWAHRRAPAKDTLTAEGARAVETAYRKFPDPANPMSKAGRLQVRPGTNSDGAAAANGSAVADQASSAAEMVRRLRRSGGAAVQFQRQVISKCGRWRCGEHGFRLPRLVDRSAWMPLFV